MAGWVELFVGSLALAIAGCGGDSSQASETSETGEGPSTGTDTTGGGSSTTNAETTTSSTTSGADTTSTDGTDSSSTGDVPTAGDPFTSGSRLRARYFDAGDNVGFSRWRDTELEVDCSFVPDTEGTMRCMPGRVPTSSSPTRVYYVDADCTQPVGTRGDCTDAEYVMELAPDSPACTWSTPMRTWAFGAEVPTPRAVYRPQWDGCHPSMLPAGPVYAVEPVAPESFVAADVVHVSVDGALGLEILEGEDGSRQWLANLDVARDHVCAAGDVLDTQYCLSVYTSIIGGEFSQDDECTSRNLAAMRAGPSCDPLDFVRVGGYPYGIGLEVPAANVFRNNDGCAPTPDGPLRYFTQGGVIPIDSLPVLAETTMGAERLQSWHWATPDGTELAHRLRWYDSESEATCRPVRVDDDSYVCPVEQHGDGFADPECTVPIRHLGLFDRDAPLAMPTAVGFASLGPSCENEFDFGYEVLGIHEGPEYWLIGDPPVCMPVFERSTDVLVVVGDEVGPEAFPALPLVTE